MKHYSFLLLPEFSNLCLANSVEPLRAANHFATDDAYRWSLVSIDGGPVASSSGFLLPVNNDLHHLLKSDPPDALFVLASYSYQMHTTAEVVSVLRQAKSVVSLLGGFDAGSFTLAKAGLLDGYKATIHWAEIEVFKETFPKITVCHDRYVYDRNRITSGGATTSLDVMLSLIRQDLGESAAIRISDLFIFDTERPGSTQQREHLSSRMEEKSPRLSRVITIMEKHIEKPLSISKIANLAGASQRQMERDFKDILNTTAEKHYASLRVAVAHGLITETGLSITEISIRSGFRSLASFNRNYKSFYGCTPSADRLKKPPI